MRGSVPSVVRNTAEVLDWELRSHGVLELILSRWMGCWRRPSVPAPAVRSHGATLRSSQKDRAEADGSDWWVWGADVVIHVTLSILFWGYSRLSNTHGGKN